jgi:hypothetical protein
MSVEDFEIYEKEEVAAYPVLGKYGHYDPVRKDGDIFCSLDKLNLLDVGVLCTDRNLAPASVIMAPEEYQRICQLYHSDEDDEQKKFQEDSLVLAAKIDRYMYGYDTTAVSDRNPFIQNVAKDLREENAGYIIGHLRDILSYSDKNSVDFFEAKTVLNCITQFNSKYHAQGKQIVVDVEVSQLKQITKYGNRR